MQVVLGLTAIAAGGYGLQRLVLPWLREYYDRWAAAKRDEQEGAAGGKRGGKALTAEEQGTAGVLADAIRVKHQCNLTLLIVCSSTERKLPVMVLSRCYQGRVRGTRSCRLSYASLAIACAEESKR